MNRKLIVFITMLLTLTLIVSLSMAASSYTIDAPITSGTKLSASEWYSTAKTRAMLTVCVSVDTLSQLSDADSNAYSSFWTNSSWVGLSANKQQVMVAGYYSTQTSTTVLVMVYTPSTGKIEYMPIVSKPALSDSNAEMICEAVFTNNSTSSEYQQNSKLEILSIISDLQQ